MRIFILLISLLVATIGVGQRPTLSPGLMESINNRIEKKNTPSVAIGIINPSGSYFYNFGYTRNNGTAVNEHSVYEIGSISKTFTATLLAQAVLDGKIKLEDPVQKYLPGEVRMPRFDGAEILIGQLSDHSSSLPRMPSNFTPADPANPYKDYTIKQLYDFLNSVELTTPIGSHFEYSNLAVGLLGLILADLENTSFEELLKTKITGPLHMEESSITLSPKMKANLAYGHSAGEEVSNWDILTLAGAGGIRSTTFDMLKYLGAQLGIPSTSLAPAVELTHQQRHALDGNSIGLGWFIVDSPSGKIYLHNGGTGGYTSFAGFCKETATGVVVLTNSNSGADDIGMHLLDPSFELKKVTQNISLVIHEHIQKKGPKGLDKLYKEYQKENPGGHDILLENEINGIGYRYLGEKKLKEALAIFKLNMEKFPSSSNVYDSYAEALMEQGKTKQSIKYYQKSLELNPGNENAVQKLKQMGVTAERKEFQVKPEILQSYVGSYNLFPGFNVDITVEGSQIFLQATGQPKFEIYPTSNTSFYLKVVEAKVDFSKDSDGNTMLHLTQNGQTIPGKKI